MRQESKAGIAFVQPFRQDLREEGCGVGLPSKAVTPLICTLPTVHSSRTVSTFLLVGEAA